MREIKFRAWNEKEEYMEELAWPFYIQDSETIIDVRSGGGFSKELKRKVMQYTGLKDKNGKEVYEGDIVKMLSRSLSQVYFADGGFCVDVGGELVGLHPDFLGRYRTVEVIGNIYKNPKLLKEN